MGEAIGRVFADSQMGWAWQTRDGVEGWGNAQQVRTHGDIHNVPVIP